jgi:hypothetical protein
LSLCKELVAFFYDLMSSTHKVDILILEEVRYNITAEDETHSTFILSPSAHSLFRVRPKKVTEDALVGDLEGTDEL